MKRRIYVSVGVVGAAIAASSVFVQDAESTEFTALLNPSHDCSFCHTLHSAPGPNLSLGTDVDVLCLTCHGAAGTSTLKAAVHANSRRSDFDPIITTCMTCHNPHDGVTNWLGGTNIKLVGSVLDGSGLARILTINRGIQDVVFESLGQSEGEPLLHSFADNDADGNGIRDGICQICHTIVGHHTFDAPDTHNITKRCTNCHVHLDGFIK